MTFSPTLTGARLPADETLRRNLAKGFRNWKRFLTRGLSAMQVRGELTPDTDPDALADVVLAAIQGGILLSRTKQDVKPLQHALDAALTCLRAYGARPAPQSSQRQAI